MAHESQVHEDVPEARVLEVHALLLNRLRRELFLLLDLLFPALSLAVDLQFCETLLILLLFAFI